MEVSGERLRKCQKKVIIRMTIPSIRDRLRTEFGGGGGFACGVFLGNIRGG